GLAVAEGLAADGGRVAVLGRRRAALDAAEQAIRGRGAIDVVALPADDAAARRAASAAGVLPAARTARRAPPLLRAAPWARVVNVTAMSVQHQSTGLVSYTAAKSALLSVTKNLARSLASDAILVNAVAPGPILTDWARPALASAGIASNDPVGAFGLLGRGHGMSVDLGRLGLPHEVAAVIAFCASPVNTYMTGGHLNVDGGSDFLCARCFLGL